MPTQLQELTGLSKTAEEALQRIQNIIGDRNHVEEARIRFPRGYLRTISPTYFELPEIGDNTKRRNFAYRLLMADMCRWLLSRTDIYGQMRSVVVSEYICILAFGAEFFVKECTFGKVRRKKKFTSHTEWLYQQGYLTRRLKGDVDWLWDVRTREHLDASSDLDHNTYGIADYNRAQRTWTKLLSALHPPTIGRVAPRLLF
jgi:hypothetical protein